MAPVLEKPKFPPVPPPKAHPNLASSITVFTRGLIAPWTTALGHLGDSYVKARLAAEIQRQASMVGYINAFDLMTLVPVRSRLGLFGGSDCLITKARNALRIMIAQGNPAPTNELYASATASSVAAAANRLGTKDEAMTMMFGKRLLCWPLISVADSLQRQARKKVQRG